MERSFDVIYYSLSGTIILTLLCTVFYGFKIRRALADPLQRNRALGLSLTALGMGVSVIGGVLLTDLARSGALSDLLEQQARFSVFYAGNGLILYGIDATASAARQSDPFLSDERRWVLLRVLLWASFAIAVLIAALYLFNPGTYTFTYKGNRQHAVQQQVFYLPLFVTTAIGAILLPFLAVRSKDAALRGHLIWFGLFAAFVGVGLLRESVIIPLSADPLIDMLVAFVPFTVAGISLCLAVRSLPIGGEVVVRSALAQPRQQDRLT